jgi:hypothetical protein
MSVLCLFADPVAGRNRLPWKVVLTLQKASVLLLTCLTSLVGVCLTFMVYPGDWSVGYWRNLLGMNIGCSATYLSADCSFILFSTKLYIFSPVVIEQLFFDIFSRKDANGVNAGFSAC